MCELQILNIKKLFYILVLGSSLFAFQDKVNAKAFSFDYLSVDVQCSIKCDSGRKKKFWATQKVFSPAGIGLKRGNGKLWGSLAPGLWLWATDICYIEAKSKALCRDESNISSVHPTELRSGKWRWTEKPGCSANQFAISPYDKNSKSHRLEFADFEESSVRVIDRSIDLKEKPDCVEKQKVKVCYGDCLADICTPGSNFVETLCTLGPGAKHEVEICLDDLLQKPKSLNRAQEVIRCDKAILSSINNNLHGACAAFRFDSICEEFAEKRWSSIKSPLKKSSSSKAK